MKRSIIGMLIALCWMTSLMGISVRNTTEKNVSLTATFPGQTISTTITMPPHSRETIEFSQNVPTMQVTMSSLVPAHKQMTPLEPLKGSRGWLFVGKNAEKQDLFVPLFGKKETALEGATTTYALIDDTITRIDSFSERVNEADTYSQTLSPASYESAIEPQSYVMVLQDKQLLAKLYALRVVRSAAIKMYRKK